ncbi:serine/threonine-protein kinase [Polyangium jinanense]|uniref:Protein kinase n=1 Tax=Polyangium jinanense TaxID=2829994 RepID=A0A9X4AZM3_9BACT|nr:serine/threonine protein kinase [Polyangium jinanense]MDC3959000.1 protein kinase [Polyangium jinanense]MDC3988475.1 protein kinase [Polyangium jinanense]
MNLSARDVQPGDILADKYRVERILGKGGMGVVVAALHLDLHEKRAIKLMLPNQLGNAVAVERFLREARATVRLRSEHITQVYDVGRLDSGAPFIVMELLRGLDLAQLLRKTGPLPTDLAALYVFQACKALAEAHAAGIVHRDIKPSNLFLTTRPDGSPCIKVVDFGISKQLPLPGVEAVDVTGANDIMGSLLYMSPEQMRSSKNVDGRTDVWALGAVLYKLVTNQVPFEASNHVEIFATVLDGTPCEPPGKYRLDLEPGLEEVILRCLEHDMTTRMPSMVELMSELAPYLPGNAKVAEDPDDDAPTLHRAFLPKRESPTARAEVPSQPWGRPTDLRNLKHTIPIVSAQAVRAALPALPPGSDDIDEFPYLPKPLVAQKVPSITTPLPIAPSWPWPPAASPRAKMDSPPGSELVRVPSSMPPPTAWEKFPSSFPPPSPAEPDSRLCAPTMTSERDSPGPMPLFHPATKPADNERSRLRVAGVMAASGAVMLIGATALVGALWVWLGKVASPQEPTGPATTASPVPPKAPTSAAPPNPTPAPVSTASASAPEASTSPSATPPSIASTTRPPSSPGKTSAPAPRSAPTPVATGVISKPPKNRKGSVNDPFGGVPF